MTLGGVVPFWQFVAKRVFGDRTKGCQLSAVSFQPEGLAVASVGAMRFVAKCIFGDRTPFVAVLGFLGRSCMGEYGGWRPKTLWLTR